MGCKATPLGRAPTQRQRQQGAHLACACKAPQGGPGTYWTLEHLAYGAEGANAARCSSDSHHAVGERRRLPGSAIRVVRHAAAHVSRDQRAHTASSPTTAADGSCRCCTQPTNLCLLQLPRRPVPSSACSHVLRFCGARVLRRMVHLLGRHRGAAQVLAAAALG